MTWRKITSGLPDNEFTRAIREDPSRRGLLYCGTETGIYMSPTTAFAGIVSAAICRSCRSMI